MKKNLQLILFLGVALFILSACTQQVSETTTEETDTGTEPTITVESSEEETSRETDDTTPSVPEEDNVIQITSSGFSPSILTVSAGTTVTFIIMDEGTYWPASASHPSHTVYPTTGGCIGSTFDACKGLAQGESFDFTFNEAGEWKYHDHLNPGRTGTIIVE
ncbi:MAG: Plastocyanin [archaeon GW2011_AR17]|nr:MAG: Plastocyanin [archaeon GW2011_AR17]MBS3153873.1 cupredoxin domain-containing protein [Candidatus Woesearchaeota archaeon]HIH15474.1 hypothetical protein [Nanoarchaeota archaeon]HIH59277.1 hypothetical protein [Nanoarchaeota archaeon]HII13928.1 hypothetical protein [Nanoarchaeota archaeon]